MLCVGIARHGYGAWVAIRDDPELGMSDKFFLEEHRVDKKEERNKGEEKNAKSPGAVHLVRRANYLLAVLKEKSGANPNAKRVIENHHRNNRKSLLGPNRRTDKPTSVSASPLPTNNMRKVVRDSERAHGRSNSNSEGRGDSRQKDHGNLDHRHRHSDHSRKDNYRHESRASVDRHNSGVSDRKNTPDIRRKISGDIDRARPKDSDRGHNHKRSVESASNHVPEQKSDDYAEKKLRPVRDNLGRLKKATSKNFPQKDTLIRVLKIELIAVGNYIRAETRDQPALEARLWECVATRYWPLKTVEVRKVTAMYDKMISSEMDAKKEGAPQTNGKSNGA
jgi:chromodomain-helicase-DNA-binding protein 1